MAAVDGIGLDAVGKTCIVNKFEGKPAKIEWVGLHSNGERRTKLQENCRGFRASGPSALSQLILGKPPRYANT